MRKPIVLVITAVLFLAAVSCRKDDGEGYVQLPILMYHHVASEGDGASTISAEDFEMQMRKLYELGYYAASFDEIIAYVDNGAPLPEKSVCIVFDDGYESNYTVAYPILKTLGFRATISLITSSMGAKEYKTSGREIIPHLSWEQAREMRASGLVDFACHSHDMHMTAAFEAGTPRQFCAVLPHESASSFVSVLVRDCEIASSAMFTELFTTPNVFAYPHGVWDAYSENTLHALGYRVTLISESGVNIVIKGDPNSLYLMRRYNISNNSDFNAVIDVMSRR